MTDISIIFIRHKKTNCSIFKITQTDAEMKEIHYKKFYLWYCMAENNRRYILISSDTL